MLASVFAVLLALPMLAAPLSIFDGGIAASAGTFILHGRVPYRDFWFLYGPLSAYLAAALTAVFGTDLTVLRIAGIVLVGLTAGLGYGLIRNVAPGIPGAVLATSAAAIAVRWTGVDLWPWALSMVLVLAAILAAQPGTGRSLLLAGAILGLAALARQDLGVYGLAAVSVSSRSLKPLAGAALILVPVGALLLLLVPIQALVEQLVWFPLLGQREFRGLPGPSLNSLLDPSATLQWLIYWPPIAVIVLMLIRGWRRRSMSPTAIALVILAILCRLQTLARGDATHSAEAILPALLLLAFAIPRPQRLVQRFVLSLGAALLVALAALPLTTIGAAPVPYDAALRAAAALVRSQTATDEPIFVGEFRNEHTLLNPLIGYYLADRPPGVHDTMYNPGVTNTDAAQTQMVTDLRTNRVRFLILDVPLADCFEPANDSRLVGSTILDKAIAKDYMVVADFGAVVIMGLRGVVNPVAVPQVWVDPAPPSGGALSCPSISTP